MSSADARSSSSSSSSDSCTLRSQLRSGCPPAPSEGTPSEGVLGASKGVSPCHDAPPPAAGLRSASPRAGPPPEGASLTWGSG
eukprot:2017791-Pyramimonas_sp.AAC.1